VADVHTDSKMAKKPLALRPSPHLARVAVLALSVLGLLVSHNAFGSEASKRDWALYKTFYSEGTISFASIVGIGTVPVGVGFSTSSKKPILHWYVDKNTFKRSGSLIAFDLVFQAAVGSAPSFLAENVAIDCSVRTFLMPTMQIFSGPLATGTPKKLKPYMKKAKVSTGDLNAVDLAYFCEGPNHEAVPSVTNGN
jgi:hypothetical protein